MKVLLGIACLLLIECTPRAPTVAVRDARTRVIPALKLWVDTRQYRQVHHQRSDTIDKVDSSSFRAAVWWLPQQRTRSPLTRLDLRRTSGRTLCASSRAQPGSMST
jgi:hypothetical protein